MLAAVLVAGYVVTVGFVRQLTALNAGPVCVTLLIYLAVGVIVTRRHLGLRIRRHLGSHRHRRGRSPRSS